MSIRLSRLGLLIIALPSIAGCSMPQDSSAPAGTTAMPIVRAPTETPRPATVAPPTAPVQVAGVALPDPRLTPGELFANVSTAQVCTAGWASAHRHVTASQDGEVYAEYGIAYPEPTGSYELDHLIPLELGGDNADANLWPEAATPAPGYHEKDRLENTLHDLVCAGQLGLNTAQQVVAGNWYAAYQRYVGG